MLIFKNKQVSIGIAGGVILGLLNILATFFTTKNLNLQKYFIRTTIKFAIILVLFYTLLKLNANVIAILGGFTMPMFAMCLEIIRSKTICDKRSRTQL